MVNSDFYDTDGAITLQNAYNEQQRKRLNDLLLFFVLLFGDKVLS